MQKPRSDQVYSGKIVPILVFARYGALYAKIVMKILEVNIELTEGLSIQEKNSFWDDFISKAIEANSLQYGGLEHGFIEPEGDFELTENHKQKVMSWLSDRMDVNKYDLQLINDST